MTAPSALAIDPARPSVAEDRWREWLRRHPPPPLSLPEGSDVVVVAPHPDDEVLGVGGAMLSLAQRANQLTVIGVTDGEAADPHAAAPARERLRQRRSEEVATALALLLGSHSCRRLRLGLPDGAVGRHEATLTSRLTTLIDGAALVLTTWRGDRHTDHEACGRATRAAADRLSVRCLEYPIWAWTWATPGATELDWHRALGHRLDAATLAAKCRAAAAFASQLEPQRSAPPVVPAQILERLLRPVEVLFS